MIFWFQPIKTINCRFRFMLSTIRITLLFCFVLTLFSNTVSTRIAAIKSGKNIILHNDNVELVWADFEARAVRKSPYAANTSSGFSFNTEIVGDSLKITLYCEFHKNESWVKKGQSNPSLLKHEQGHFNITELHCRNMRQQIQEGQFSFNDLNKRISKILKSENKALNTAQKKYDKETNHNLNIEIQRKWDKYILDQLEITAKYSIPQFMIAVEK